MIIQIIPCNEKLNAVYENDLGFEEIRMRVLAFALCDDGCVYPLMFDPEKGIDRTPDIYYVLKFELKERKQ